jgi:hypothetical protein
VKQILTLSSLLASLTLVFAGCEPAVDDGNEVDCTAGKCDMPGSTADAECRAMFPSDTDAQNECRKEKAFGHCELRRSDALNGSQLAFTKDAIRWAAADVEGVNTNGADHRGLEYAEYFAVVLPPPETEGGDAPAVIGLGHNVGGSISAPNIDLSAEQIFALEDEPDAIVGQCVFTTWHSDVNEPLPACEGSELTCPELLFSDSNELASWIAGDSTGMKLNSTNFKMQAPLNSNGAASALASDCMTNPLVADPDDPSDALHDDFTRGCMKAFSLFKTEWRRSDSAICVAGGRLTECGCGIDTNADGLADVTNPSAIAVALIPKQPQDNEITLRGFPMGTWSGADELPAGCDYTVTGDDSQVIVTCDITGADLLQGAADVKERCRSKYGNNVVVYVPVPGDSIVCTPPTDGAHADSCSEFPWVVSAN